MMSFGQRVDGNSVAIRRAVLWILRHVLQLEHCPSRDPVFSELRQYLLVSVSNACLMQGTLFVTHKERRNGEA